MNISKVKKKIAAFLDSSRVQVTLERYVDIITIQIPNSKRQDFLNLLKNVKNNGGLILTSNNNEQVVFMKSTDFIVDASKIKNILIQLPPKEWQFLEEAVQEHLDENREFPLDHSFESYGAKITPQTVKDVVIETVDESCS